MPFTKSKARQTSGRHGRIVEVVLGFFGQSVPPLEYRAVEDEYQLVTSNATDQLQRYSASSFGPGFHLRLRISGPPNKRLLLTFENVSLADCRSQYFTLHDMPTGNAAGDAQLNTEDFFFCSAEDFAHSQFESMNNSLELYFHNSNASRPTDYFTVIYVTESCQREVAAQSGLILSPSGAMMLRHENNQECEVKIRAPGYQYLHLHFFMFSVERHPSCAWDSVQFFNTTADGSRGPSVTSKLCGEAVPRPFALALPVNGILLRFVTDSSVVGYGYRLTHFGTNSSACGGGITGQLRGGIQSPATVEQGAVCQWEVVLPASTRVWHHPVIHATIANITCDAAVLQIELDGYNRTVCSTNYELTDNALSGVDRFRVFFTSAGNNEHFQLTWRFT